MRTKVLLALAALAAGALTTMAQSNVYSLNVVGYINVPLVDGYNLVANQLDKDGTGTNNTIAGVFSNSLPLNAGVFKFNGAAWVSTFYTKSGKGTSATTNWDSNAALTINPGEGFFLNIPTGTYGSGSGTYTFVGNVLQGNLVNTYIPAAGGYAVLSSMVPLAGGLQNSLNYRPLLNDGAYIWNPTNQSWGSTFYTKSGKGTSATTNWSPTEPNLSVGQSFFLNTSAGSTWTTNFNVPQQ